MTDLRVVAIIQARMASSRLPGKVLLDLGGQPNLQWMINRVRRAKLVDEVVLATTVDPSDDPVAAFCEAQGVPYYRGDMHDVLDRYYQAAQIHKADIIVRLTGDCPLIDPTLLDSNLQAFLDAQPPLDFAANRFPGDRTVPIGLDTEICTMAGLIRTWNEADQKYQREHVMPYFYDEPDRFNIQHLTYEIDYGDYRWTLDTPEDLILLREIVKHFKDDTFSWLDVIRLVQDKPEIMNINAAVQHKTKYDVDDRA